MHRVHDPIYGYIELEEYERKLIDNLIFQRLRGIHQQGTTYLTYPSSKHDRFSHSLGVLKVTSNFLDSLFPVLFRAMPETSFILLKRMMRIICLCHDLGHGPFSHVSDRIFLKNLSDEDKFEMQKHGISSPHELFTCRLMKDFIPCYLDNIEDDYTETIEHSREPPVPFEDFRRAIERNGPLFFDKDSPLYFFPLKEERTIPYWKVFKQILDSDFDADKIDYIQRDGYITGVKVGHLDVPGLLENIIVDDRPGQEDVAFARQAISAIETLIIERYKLFRWLNFHHTVCFSDELMARIIELSEGKAFDEKMFTYEYFKELAMRELEALKNKQILLDLEVLDDSFVISSVRQAYKNMKEDADIKMARYYLNLIETRRFYTSIWRVESKLTPEEESTLFKLKSAILRQGKSILAYCNQIEEEIAKEAKVNKTDVLIAYKPFEPVPPEVKIKVLTNGCFKNIKEVLASVALFEWRRRNIPAEIRKRIQDIVGHEIRSETREELNNFLTEKLEDMPQVFTPIYVYVKGISRTTADELRPKIIKIIQRYL